MRQYQSDSVLLGIKDTRRVSVSLLGLSKTLALMDFVGHRLGLSGYIQTAPNI